MLNLSTLTLEILLILYRVKNFFMYNIVQSKIILYAFKPQKIIFLVYWFRKCRLSFYYYTNLIIPYDTIMLKKLLLTVFFLTKLLILYFTHDELG